MSVVPLRAPATAAPPARRQEEPTFSVLVPTWNCAATLRAAVVSALEQDPPPLEVVVSNDGSDDDVASALSGLGSPVVLVMGPHAGPSAARNRAAAVARGTYLLLLDADDVLLPGKIAGIADALVARPDLDIVTTDAYMVVDGERQGRAYETLNRWCDGDQRRGILEWNFVFGQAAVRRDRFDEVGGYDVSLSSAEDWDLWLRLVLTGSAAGLVNLPLGEYRRRSGSLTTQRYGMARNRLDLLERALALTTDDGEREVIRNSRSALRVRALPLAVDGDQPDARVLCRTIALDPRAPLRSRVTAAGVGLWPRGVARLRRRLGREHPGARP